MGWFTRDTEADAMPKGTLTPDERASLIRLESAVEAGVSVTTTLIEAGKALAEIRSRQLYRDTAATWEEYVDARFRITRRRADQIVSFAAVKAALEETGTQVPELSEKAARPLVGLPAATMADVVSEAAQSPEGITAGSIRKAAAKRRKGKAAKVPRPRRFKVPGAIVTITFNRKGTGSALDALAAATTQAEADLLEHASEAA
jgi:hypothetical protein